MEIPAFRPGMKRRFTSPEMSVVSDSMFACPDIACSPTLAQEAVLRDHCGHARYVWNLAVAQHSHCARAARALRATWSSVGS